MCAGDCTRSRGRIYCSWRTFFTAMLASEYWTVGTDEPFFIDCYNDGFEQVLRTLRGEALTLSNREGEVWGDGVLEALEFLRLPAHGTYTYASGDYKRDGIFDGDWLNGYQSVGKFTWAEGMSYEGQYRGSVQELDYLQEYTRRHVKDGHGILSFGDGRGYVGEWNNDMTHGQGTLNWSDGDVYVGEWRNDQREGRGKQIWGDDGTSYDGEWKCSLRHGHGTQTYANGDVYTGEWVHHGRDGHGTYTTADGEVYVGQWKEGERHGRGVATLANGTVCDRIYLDGELLEDDEVQEQPLGDAEENDEV